jgi:hypothetical protein
MTARLRYRSCRLLCFRSCPRSGLRPRPAVSVLPHGRCHSVRHFTLARCVARSRRDVPRVRLPRRAEPLTSLVSLLLQRSSPAGADSRDPGSDWPDQLRPASRAPADPRQSCTAGLPGSWEHPRVNVNQWWRRGGSATSSSLRAGWAHLGVNSREPPAPGRGSLSVASRPDHITVEGHRLYGHGFDSRRGRRRPYRRSRRSFGADE